MKIGEDVIEHIKSYVIEELLDGDNDDYEYYIDEVALAIDPTVVHVFLYSDASAKVVKHLTENGLVHSDNMDNYQTMAYRDMLYVMIITNKERYETMENNNIKMELISLNNIVTWAKKQGYRKNDIIDLLHRTIVYTK